MVDLASPADILSGSSRNHSSPHELKDVERFRNGSFHEFCRLKALITLKEVNTSYVETRKNVHEQNFDDEVKNNSQANRR